MSDYPVTNNARGLLKALPRHLLPEGTFFLSDNMTLYQGVVQPVDGYVPFSLSPIDPPPMLLDSFDRPDGVNRLICITRTGWYYYDATLDAWVLLTRLVENPVNGPVLVVFSTGGSLAGGTYSVRYTYYNASGETIGSPNTISGLVTGPNGRIDVTLPANPPGAQGKVIYASLSPTGSELRVGTTTGTTFTITTLLVPTPGVPLNAGMETWSGGVSVAPDSWLFSGVSIAQDAVNKHSGSFSASVTRVGTNPDLTQFLDSESQPGSIFSSAALIGRQVMGAGWVRATVAARARIQITVPATVSSAQHSGGGTFEHLFTALTVVVGPQVSLRGTITTGDTTAQFDDMEWYVGVPVSNLALYPYTGGLDDIWTSDIGPNPNTPFINYFATNNKDAVQVWDTELTTRPRDLLGSLASGDNGRHYSKTIAEFYNSLFHLNRLEAGVRLPRLLRWSDAGLPEVYTGGVSGNLTLYQGADHGAGVRLEPITGYLAAYRERSIHLINFVGSPFFFAQRQVIMGRGLLAPRALVNLGSKHLFLGTDNVYVFNGVDLTAIGDDIRDELYGSLNYSTVQRSLMLYRTDHNEVQLCVPTIGGLGNPDTWWLWNATTESWSGPIIDREVTAGCEHGFLAMTWDDSSGSWNSSTYTWDTIPLLRIRPKQLFGNSEVTVFITVASTTQANGVDVTARWESRAFNPGAELQPPSVEMICTDILPLGSTDTHLRWYIGASDSPVGPFVFHGPYTLGVRGLVKTKPTRGKWFVFAVEMEHAHTVAGFIATFEPGWTFAPVG